MELARRLLGPPKRGIEIGASAIAPFPGVRSYNIDLAADAPYREAEMRFAGTTTTKHVFGSADAMPFADESSDFVLASHVIEHMPDAIGALLEWDRVVRVGGHLFLIVPHRDRTFDSDRATTSFSHLLYDHADKMTTSRHPLVPTSHYNVWTTASFLGLVKTLNSIGAVDWETEVVEDADSRFGNGFTCVLRKRSTLGHHTRPTPLERTLPFWHCTLRMPFQVEKRDLEFVIDDLDAAAATLPPGEYDCVRVDPSFPPRVLERCRRSIGAPQPPPVVERAIWLEGGRYLHFVGRDFAFASYLEADLGHGVLYRFLPKQKRGDLVVDMEGLVLPKGRIGVRVITPPPGGGSSSIDLDLS